jgi:hypothetical protein
MTMKSRTCLKTRDAQICLSQDIDLSLPKHPPPRLSKQALRQALRFQALSKAKQRFVIQMIDLLETTMPKT